MAHQTDQKPTLVLGGTGKTGRRIIERLEALGVPTRLGSRTVALPVGDVNEPLVDVDVRETAATGIWES